MRQVVQFVAAPVVLHCPALDTILSDESWHLRSRRPGLQSFCVILRAIPTRGPCTPATRPGRRMGGGYDNPTYVFNDPRGDYCMSQGAGLDPDLGGQCLLGRCRSTTWWLRSHRPIVTESSVSSGYCACSLCRFWEQQVASHFKALSLSRFNPEPL